MNVPIADFLTKPATVLATVGLGVVSVGVATLADIGWTTELGIAGLCVSGSLSFAAYVVSSANARDNARVSTFTEHVNKVTEDHRAERKEWREDMMTAQERSNAVIEKLEQAFREVISDRQD